MPARTGLSAGGLAGYACYGPTPLTDGTYDLYWMAVAPGCRRRKYGQDLIGWVEDGVRQSGGRLIVVETSSQEKYAGTRSFYARMGYEAAARIRDYYRAGDDLVIFRKSLIGEGA